MKVTKKQLLTILGIVGTTGAVYSGLQFMKSKKEITPEEEIEIEFDETQIKQRIETMKKFIGLEKLPTFKTKKNIQILSDSDLIIRPDGKFELAKYIDHTVLSANATALKVKTLCQEAVDNEFASVCVNSSRVKECKNLISKMTKLKLEKEKEEKKEEEEEKVEKKNEDEDEDEEEEEKIVIDEEEEKKEEEKEEKVQEVEVCSVIGFPLGACTTKSKVIEAQEAIEAGATEIDMVINVGKLLDGDYKFIYQDIKDIVDKINELDQNEEICLKVIIECAYLTNNQLKVDACILSALAGADYVKTSTGMATKVKVVGATLKDVDLMRRTVDIVTGKKNLIGVKAAGGIGNYQQTVDFIKNGANRIGASKGISIIA